MEQILISLAIIGILMSIIFAIYTVLMTVCVSDMKNIINLPKLVKHPIEVSCSNQHVVCVEYTRAIFEYSTHMKRVFSDVGLEYREEEQWTVCNTYSYYGSTHKQRSIVC